MFARIYLTGMAVAVAAGVGWKLYASGELANRLRPEAPKPVIKFDNDAPPSAGPALLNEPPPQQVSRKAPSGIHKCKVGDSVIYTDAPCDKPSAEQAIGKGSVTVVKGHKPTSSASDSASGGPGKKTLEQSIIDKHIDRQVGP